MYASTNFKTKKEFKEAVKNGQKIMLFAPGLGKPAVNGTDTVEGPWYPAPHTWYAKVTVVNGIVIKVE